MGCWTVIKSFHVKIILLDKQELIQEIQGKTTGQDLLDNIYKYLNLIETAYFGLRYQDNSNQTHWLDPTKRVSQQIKGVSPITLYLGVKFYAADPCKLVEEITRYQFFLQVKLDILQGRLPVSTELATELASLSLQSELGDYDENRHSPGYSSEFRFLASQTEELEAQVERGHAKIVGLLPSQAENRYLEKVKWLDMYGVDLHAVIGEDNIEYFLGLTPSGIIVLRNRNKVGNYFWPRISKIYFKGKYFMLRVRDKNNEESTYGFETPSRQACKHLWKCCVEHHAFFRLVQVNPTVASSGMFGLGSKFRYSGRTEKEMGEEVSEIRRPPPPFARSPSQRFSRRSRSEEPVSGNLDGKLVGSSTILERKENGVSQGNLVTKHLSNNNLFELTPHGNSVPRHSSMTGLQSLPANLREAEGTADMSLQSLQYLESKGLFGSRERTRHGSEPETNHGYLSGNNSLNYSKKKSSRRGGSDEESELSGISLTSGRNYRSKSDRGVDSGSESESSRTARKNHRGRRMRSGSYKLVETDEQWREVQQQQGRRGQVGISEATVRKSGYINSGAETESELVTTLRRNKRRQRSRSRSPSDVRSKLPSELVKHFEFDLQEPPNDQTQLHEIPYTNVKTQKPIKVKFGSNGRRSRHTSGNSSRQKLPNDSSWESEASGSSNLHTAGVDQDNRNISFNEQNKYNGNVFKTKSLPESANQDGGHWEKSSRVGGYQNLDNETHQSVQSSKINQGYRSESNMTSSVPPPNVTKPMPPLPPNDALQQDSHGNTKIQINYANHNSYNDNVIHNNSINQMNLKNGSHHHSTYQVSHSSLPPHILNKPYNTSSPVMGYKAVNPPIGTMLNDSSNGLPNLRDGGIQHSQMTLMSSSNNTSSSSSSPRQGNSHMPDNFPHSLPGLASTGPSSSKSYAPVYNGNVSHHSPVTNHQYQTENIRRSPHNSKYSGSIKAPGIRQGASSGNNSPSRHTRNGPPPPPPSMIGRHQPNSQPQTPQNRQREGSNPTNTPRRIVNSQTNSNQQISEKVKQDKFSKNWPPNSQHVNKVIVPGGKRSGNPYEPSGDEMSTEL